MLAAVAPVALLWAALCKVDEVLNGCPGSGGVTVPGGVPEPWGYGTEGCEQWRWGWMWRSEQSYPTVMIL